MQYKIKERYQHRTSEGIKYTDWFYCLLCEFKSLEEAENTLNRYRSIAKDIAKSTKLKTEFSLVVLNENKR